MLMSKPISYGDKLLNKKIDEFFAEEGEVAEDYFLQSEAVEEEDEGYSSLNDYDLNQYNPDYAEEEYFEEEDDVL